MAPDAPAAGTQTANARRYGDRPCWRVDNDPWESPHFDTKAQAVCNANAAQAEAYAADPDELHRRAPVIQLACPCWIRMCEQDGCVVEEVDDDFDSPVHWPGDSAPAGFKCEDHREREPWEMTL